MRKPHEWLKAAWRDLSDDRNTYWDTCTIFEVMTAKSSVFHEFGNWHINVALGCSRTHPQENARKVATLSWLKALVAHYHCFLDLMPPPGAVTIVDEERNAVLQSCNYTYKKVQGYRVRVNGKDKTCFPLAGLKAPEDAPELTHTVKDSYYEGGLADRQVYPRNSGPLLAE
ncbi:hypothetical protein CYMTET_15359 [Cymbomonas tetramitiformis]|uniref:Uncharacterized protein n=1 Tax=Cymbomonas tetramitiformis TaxID=36881 RepID=A0AAE0L9D4_9CHLO|nr:hypothetical protein CYMTET_15359 [Cymbomonas tetramitiformis]